MTTTIKATHDGCGFIELLPINIRLKTFAPSDCRDFYEFVCPTCGILVQKTADDAIISLLRRGDVPETKVFLPLEALDPMRNLTEPFTVDDILDFHISMQCTTSALTEFLSS